MGDNISPSPEILGRYCTFWWLTRRQSTYGTSQKIVIFCSGLFAFTDHEDIFIPMKIRRYYAQDIFKGTLGDHSKKDDIRPKLIRLPKFDRCSEICGYAVKGISIPPCTTQRVGGREGSLHSWSQLLLNYSLAWQQYHRPFDGLIASVVIALVECRVLSHYLWNKI
jgi:hypothetical protein